MALSMGQMKPELSVMLCEKRYTDLLRTDSRILIAADLRPLRFTSVCTEGVEYRIVCNA